MINKIPFTLAAGAVAALILAGPAEAQTKTVVTKSTSVMTTTTMTPPPHAAMPMEMPTPNMQALLNAYANLKPKQIEIMNAEDARKQPTMADAVKKLLHDNNMRMPSMHGIEHESSSYLNARGDKLNVDIYYAEKRGDAAKNRPVILYFHGGGWVIANTKVYESSIVALARKTGAIVIAPTYRQAPEDRFPAAHEDAFASYYWTLKMAHKYGGDATRIAVVGESAGGNLAANVGMMARDEHLQQPVALGLIYPVAGVDMNTPSYRQNANAKPLSKAMMGWFMANIIRPESRAEAMEDVRLDLVHANLSGLPKTTVITAGIDPLRSDGEMLTGKLKAAGVPTHYQNFNGVTHEFFGADAVLPEAAAAQDLLAGDLNAAFMMPAGK